MTAPVPSGGLAVMQNRRTPLDSLDDFPTPCWATRALCEYVIADTFEIAAADVWEPAANRGIMAEVLDEYFGHVHTSDVHDYGKGYQVGSFVGEVADLATIDTRPDWVITNPPFTLAAEFAFRALDVATFGVALLVRTAWLEGGDRYRRLFSKHPPSTVAIFSERVPMVKGRWDPAASTATSYAWVVWKKPPAWPFSGTAFMWIPPGCRTSLTKSDDIARFATPAHEEE